MTSKMKEIWIVKGRVTCTDAHPTAQLGDAEWQFSDGPPGKRGSSADYTDLEEGLRDHSGCIFHWVPDARYYPLEYPGGWQVFDEKEGAPKEGCFSRREAAQCYADMLNADDARPLPNEIRISAEAADHAGRVLDALLAADTGHDLHAAADKYFWPRGTTNRAHIRSVAEALIALGNDTDAIVAPA